MKKIKTITALLIIASYLLTACSKVATETSTSSSEAESETTVETSLETTTVETSEVDPDDFERLDIEIDYYKVPPMSNEVLGSKITDGAITVIDAFFNRETEVYLGDMVEWEVDYVAGVVSMMCPPATTIAGFTAIHNYNSETGILTLNYYYDEEESQQIIAEFENATYNYLSLLGENDSEVMKAMILYYAFSKDAIYDYDLLNDPNSMSPMELAYRDGSLCPIVEHTGVCRNLARSLVFLYNQAGISAECINNMGDESDAGAHTWVIARLDGKCYYIDPTWDIFDGDEYGSIYYFGLTETDRFEIGGGYVPEYNTIWWEPVTDYYDVSDDRFVRLHVFSFMYCTDFIPDHNNQTIRIESDDYYDVVDCK